MLTIVYIIAGLIALVLILAAMRPDTFRIERKITIKAAPEKVYALLDNFHNWQSWSPWEKLDPAMNRGFTGPDNGKGAGYSWQGNKKVGKGAMEILDSQASSKLVIKLDFFEPFEAHNTAQFDLTSSGGETTVTWAMYGPSPYMMKIMHLFMNMDKMVGKDFEEGLNNLKANAEK
ncbi:MAG: SRPBCC family protein [Burkholderiaceae bacterium]|nr:SRPBCC family protein [Burkholderiaceae bacterium]